MARNMDRPSSEMAAAVARALAMANKLDAVTYLAEHRVPDRVIARLLSERAESGERRTPN